MKKVIYFILISLLGFTSCKKDGSNPVDTNTIPSMPTLSAPKDTASNIAVPVVLTWNESSGAKGYTLQVSASSSFSSFVFNKSDITTTTQLIPDLNFLAIYYWKVKATNSAGTSDWSKVWSFTTTGEAALVPQLSLPANGAIDQKLSPLISWSQVSNASKYALQISTNSSFTSFVLDEDSVTATSKQIADLSGSTKYYWRVSAANSFGTKGWSETWSFTTGVTPVPPVLLFPSDGAADIVLTPTITWNASPGATSYILQISTDSSFSSFVIDQSGSPPNKQITGLAFSIKYYWRVKAVNGFGNSSWSAIWSFNTVRCGGTTTVFYGNKTYNTIAIGNQCWMKENLDVGTMIQVTTNASNNGTIEKYCYDNDTAKCRIYGGLYQWNEAMEYSTTTAAKGICPNGWHIPSNIEFQALKATVNNDDKALKAIGQGTGTNTSGFTALLAGFRDVYGVFGYQGSYTYFWGSPAYDVSSAYVMGLDRSDSGIAFGSSLRDHGFSVRCLKDQ